MSCCSCFALLCLALPCLAFYLACSAVQCSAVRCSGGKKSISLSASFFIFLVFFSFQKNFFWFLPGDGWFLSYFFYFYAKKEGRRRRRERRRKGKKNRKNSPLGLLDFFIFLFFTLVLPCDAPLSARRLKTRREGGEQRSRDP